MPAGERIRLDELIKQSNQCEGWSLGYGLICHAPAQYSGPCSRQALLLTYHEVSSAAVLLIARLLQVSMDGATMNQKMRELNRHVGLPSKQILFSRMLEHECGVSWPAGGQKCRRNYSTPCPSGRLGKSAPRSSVVSLFSRLVDKGVWEQSRVLGSSGLSRALCKAASQRGCDVAA